MFGPILEEIEAEVVKAIGQHADFPTAHHAVAVIQEEFEEFKEVVFRKKLDRAEARKELIQVAAMCVRTIFDLEL